MPGSVVPVPPFAVSAPELTKVTGGPDPSRRLMSPPLPPVPANGSVASPPEVVMSPELVPVTAPPGLLPVRGGGGSFQIETVPPAAGQPADDGVRRVTHRGGFGMADDHQATDRRTGGEERAQEGGRSPGRWRVRAAAATVAA